MCQLEQEVGRSAQVFDGVVRFTALMPIGLIAGAPSASGARRCVRRSAPELGKRPHCSAAPDGATTAVSVAILAFLNRRAKLLWLDLASLLCIIVDQPINVEVMTWTAQSLRSDWVALRDRWWSWHIVRTSFSIAGQTLMILALLFDRLAISLPERHRVSGEPPRIYGA
ncbi:hypothetical protein JI739_10325 [Ramlibacter sp. AW1]|uniref:DUF1772 domain-containing protein n=1 Tax=Ramlibacter aurantiacus TaxID=2801330 RepID=A0A937D1P3_9BURK|nr:hypothetical protein [Ramlibacter aurantiacus]MBL0420739.1 hypothetical protein [Ramlibacter aurantiacus]